MKKAALLLAAILLLMHPAAVACLVTGEAYGVGAAAAIVLLKSASGVFTCRLSSFECQ